VDCLKCYHYKDKKSDKIWGYVINSEQCIVFYGRTKGTMSFIEHLHRVHAPRLHIERQRADNYTVPNSAYKAKQSKVNKGYVPVLDAEMDNYLPDSFKEALMLARLGMGLREAVV